MLRLSLILAITGAALGLLGATLIGLSAVLNASEPATANEVVVSPNRPTARRVVQAASQTTGVKEASLPTLTPTSQRGVSPQPLRDTPTMTPLPTEPVILTRTNLSSINNDLVTGGSGDYPTGPARTLATPGPVVTDIAPATEQSDQVQLTPTLTVSARGQALDVIAGTAQPPAVDQDYVEPYTSTDQVRPPPSASKELDVALIATCPITSESQFDLIPIEGRPRTDHPDYLHADLNLTLRGYRLISETRQLQRYNGNTDPDAPQLHGLYEPNRLPIIRSVYQINEWIWDVRQCGGNQRGCRGVPIDSFWPVTLAGLSTVPGEPVQVPERGARIYSGGFVALVLYAEEKQLTLGYTRRDSVAAGYTVHLENLCVDPNLLALYRSQKNSEGWRASGFLPAVRNNQVLGLAAGREIRVAVRDIGSFMDPRSQKDWWK
jgi:hypothetical protein